MNNALWTNCLQRLEQELSDQQLNTWIRPLQVREDNHQLTLLAPNRFVLDWVKQNFRDKIETILLEVSRDDDVNLLLENPNRHPRKNPHQSRILAFRQKLQNPGRP